MMIHALKKSRIIMCRVLETVLILAVAVLVLVVLWGVFTRYVMSEQAKWSEELARFLLIWISLLGGAAAFGEKAHLGVDYFVGKFDPSARKFITIFGQLIVLFFAVSIFMIGGINIAANNMEQLAPALGVSKLIELGPLSFEWPGLKMGHVYLALLIAGVFMIFFMVEQMLETLLTINSDEKEAN